MTGKAKIIAAGKVGEFAALETDIGAIDLLEGWSFRHVEGDSS